MIPDIIQNRHQKTPMHHHLTDDAWALLYSRIHFIHKKRRRRIIQPDVRAAPSFNFHCHHTRCCACLDSLYTSIASVILEADPP